MSMALEPGEILDDKYRINRLIGEGGMGAVYEGENLRIHRRVAIKVLHGNVASQTQAVQRFEREAQAAGRIGSEHIVEVLDLGQRPQGDRYLVMEYLEGEALSARIARHGRITPEALYPIAMQLLDGLSDAHEAGIIHRDLKPDNVFLVRSKKGQSDFVKLVDFGISKFTAMGEEMNMTRTGSVMGTPFYMSPEQAKGAKSIDQRVDIYAAGVILYECVTGHVPFDGDTFNQLLFKIVLETPPPIETLVAGIDPAFCAIINRAMAREPDQRFQTCREFLAAIEAWASPALAGMHSAPAITPALGMTPATGAQELPPAAVRGTPGAWSHTGGDVAEAAIPKRKPSPLLLAGVLTTLLLAGGGLAAYLFSNSGSGSQSAASSPPQLPGEKADTAAESAQTAPVAPVAAVAPSASSAPSDAADVPSASPSEGSEPNPSQVPPAVASSETKSAKAVPQRSLPPRAPVRTSTTPKSKTSSGTSRTDKIRTEL